MRGWVRLGAATLAIVFVAGATASAAVPTPAVQVTSAGPFVDGESVTVQVSGFAPSEKVFLSECSSLGVVTALGCGAQLAAQPFALTDERGVGVEQFTVHPSAASTSLDSTTKQACDPCVLVATQGIDADHPSNVVYAVTQLDFRGTLPFTGVREYELIWLASSLLAFGLVLTCAARSRSARRVRIRVSARKDEPAPEHQRPTRDR